MAEHRVTLSKVPEFALASADMEFKVWEDDVLLGTLKISKGSLAWRPANNKKYYRKITWADFATFAKPRRRRESSHKARQRTGRRLIIRL